MAFIIKIMRFNSCVSGRFYNYFKKTLMAVCGFLLLLGITACEAPLNLVNVDKELEKQVRRTDQFQALATNDQVMVAVGADGLVLTSPVNKVDWQRQSIADATNDSSVNSLSVNNVSANNSPMLIDIATCADQSFVALSADKSVWFSSDNGQSWSESKLPTPENMLDLTCAPDNSVWVVGSFSTLLHSDDKGTSWQAHSLNEDAMLTHIQFLDDKSVIVVGEFGLLTRSQDRGKTWSEPEFIPNDFYPQSAYFSSLNTGWVAGLDGQILYTSDGGQNWSRQETSTKSPLYQFYSINQRLFVLGDHSTVLEFTGSDWQKAKAPKRPVYIRDALKLSDGRLLLAGGQGLLYPLEIAKNHLVQQQSLDNQ